MGLINRGIAAVYDHVISRAESRSLAAWRRELLQPLSGRVLEIGAGTGSNLPHYPPAIAELILSEPDRHMRRKLCKNLTRNTLPHRLVDAPAEALPFADGSFDAVVVTLVLCSVTDPQRAIDEICRVLKPGGQLALIEHVAAPPGRLFCWQRRIEPFWKRCAGNCHLTRDTLAAVQAAGFDCHRLQTDTLRGAVAIVAPVIRGLARKP